MILADTSIWIHHFRECNSRLRKLLEQGQLLSHPFVIGELALGNLEQRELSLDALQDLPKATVARDEEVLQYISNRALFGRGIGYVDAHLLVARAMVTMTRIAGESAEGRMTVYEGRTGNAGR